MIAVVLDANSIHSDPWLAGDPGKKLLDLAAAGSCVVIYPEVVIDELLRQRREAAQRAHDQAAKGISDMGKAGIDVSQTSSDLEASFEKIGSDLDSAFQALLDRDGVRSEPVPNVPLEDIIERDLARRRPFKEVELGQKPVSVGFRDTVIWETVREVVDPARGYDRVLFVTADKGFLSDDSKSLHQDLLDDLDERGVDRSRVVSVKNVPHANSEVEEAAARAALVTAATNALYELVGEDISMQLVYGGDYDYPDFVRFGVPAMESGSISAIDQTSEFELTEAGATVTATADALLYIEGAVFKGDWFMDDGESVSISGELNDHYFEASSEVEVRVVVEMDTGEGSPQVLSIVLEDPLDEQAAVGGAEESAEGASSTGDSAAG
ncbi:PIN domain-containing protein [Microbacterium sp. CH-015]|uniref:PIN domain-containing protein n=1 Tax=Microbacterium sp. CH-015 TaxID=3406734 RepID=UPI003C70E91D